MNIDQLNEAALLFSQLSTKSQTVVIHGLRALSPDRSIADRRKSLLALRASATAFDAQATAQLIEHVERELREAVS